MSDTILDWMLTNPGIYWGLGDGEESGQFIGRIEVTRGLVGNFETLEGPEMKIVVSVKRCPTRGGGGRPRAKVVREQSKLIARRVVS